MSDRPRPFTAKQRRFVEEYLIDLNASQAAVRAGYSPKGAGVTGHKTLKMPHVAAAVAAAMAKRAEEAKLSADWVLEGLRLNYDRAMQAEPVMVRQGDRMVESGEFVYDGSVANRALELIGKHLGMFTDKVQHSGPDGGPHEVRVVHEIVDPSAG